MKKKILVICNVLLVIVLSISLFIIFGKKEEEKVILKDYSYVNVEEIKIVEASTLSDNDDNIVSVKDVRINSGYLEGTILLNSDESYDELKVIVSLFDEEDNLLDEINFEFEDVSPYEERDLFYAIQKDLSDAYYVGVRER